MGTSKGLLGLVYRDQMGIYYLIENLLIHGRPVWQHKSGKYFLRMDNEGSWILSKSQIETSQIAYFGTNMYKGVILPNIIRNMTWVHYGDDENDLDQDYQYIEDSEVLVQDVCDSEFLTPCGMNEQLD